MHTLYLCYFGLREPLVQTQVLPYLRELRRDGIDVSLLTFEPNGRRGWSRVEEKEWLSRLAEGIQWLNLPYHKRPSALVTPYDIQRGAWLAAGLSRRQKVDVWHARGHVPALMGSIAKRFLRFVIPIANYVGERELSARQRYAWSLMDTFDMLPANTINLKPDVSAAMLNEGIDEIKSH